jgi:undecaprenyl-diphosphatase
MEKMSITEGIFLGIVQGLTEFLPISSSGHLVILQYYMGLREPMLFFDIMLHLGTLGAIVIIFGKDLKKIIQEELGPILKNFGSPTRLVTTLSQARMSLFIILATLPTAILGYLGKDPLENLFSSTRPVGVALCFTGTLLWLTRYSKEKGQQFNCYHALIIGFVQGIAIIPGISRSGATIATALFLGLPKELAARFSFLLALPAILGAVTLELFSSSSLTATDLSPTLLSTFMAILIGYLALKYLLRVVYHGNLFRFAYYCWSVGIMIIILG